MAAAKSNKISIPCGTALADNQLYTNRFEIASESSDRLYIVAQNKTTGEWSCSCPGWIIKRPGKERTCKHLKAIMPMLVAAANPAPRRIEEKTEEKREKVSEKSKKGGRKINL